MNAQQEALLLKIELYQEAVHAFCKAPLDTLPVANAKLQEAEYSLNRAMRMLREADGT